MMTADALEVYETGERTVVGFGGREVLDQLDLAECRDELERIIETESCRTLAVDLKGVQLLPSGLLGLLATIRGMGVIVQVDNASADIRQLLQITELDKVLKLGDGS